ncbi:MAG TPA: hypothetical protein VH558_14595 [Pseudolabrys sp.]
MLRLRLRDQSAAVAVGRSHETASHVVAKERNACGVAAVAHCQRAAGTGNILRVRQRCVRAEGDVW